MAALLDIWELLCEHDFPVRIYNFEFHSVPDFQTFMWNPIVLQAFNELWTGYLSQQPAGDFPRRDRGHVANIVKLCEFEPQTWSYTRANPDKTNWCTESHFARFSVRLQVVRRQMSAVPPGPLPEEVRLRFVRLDYDIAKIMFKMRHAHQNFHPPRTTTIN
ncbi:hypothetical protein B0J13DRAFT_633181 [Dactylonectria estremocensis]|uniref:Uncharacterized protein n=1 Tax=Dactylonectria estremocensis TaxID=1079267 RepID=A0A9P9JKL0_9HYPO|nr:hypothetical protein B0J13DRAFT_633181 [Dactylonectria estremocensis]